MLSFFPSIFRFQIHNLLIFHLVASFFHFIRLSLLTISCIRFLIIWLIIQILKFMIIQYAQIYFNLAMLKLIVHLVLYVTSLTSNLYFVLTLKHLAIIFEFYSKSLTNDEILSSNFKNLCLTKQVLGLILVGLQLQPVELVNLQPFLV